MESSIQSRESSDSAEAIQALEAGIRIIAKIFVKAVTAELKEQSKYFGDISSGIVSSPTSDNKGIKGYDKTIVCSVEEAGKLLGISRATAYESARTGQLPSLRFGKRILIPRLALMNMIEETGSHKYGQVQS